MLMCLLLVFGCLRTSASNGTCTLFHNRSERAHIYVTHHPQMRRFAKIMVVFCVVYIDRADTDVSNDTSTFLLIV